MKKILLFNKKIGETPLQVINNFKSNNSDYSDTKMCYAGRLDPMARGLLVILVGDECKKRDEYQDLSKTYEFEILFGVKTDTYDILGMSDLISTDFNLDLISKELLKFSELNTLEQKYPPYSSFQINGRPLFWYARKKKLHEINIPSKKVKIKNFKILKKYKISTQELLKMNKERIGEVNGDFRQSEIISKWKDNISDLNSNFPVFKCSLEVSSGTYIRSICNMIGEHTGYGAIAMDINRIKIGNLSLDDLNLKSK